MARKPRLWTTDHPYEFVIRTEHQMFFLKPDDEMTNIVGSSLGRALKRHPVRIHSFETNINHIHCIFSLASNQVGNASQFLRYFDGQLAKQINIHYSRKGHVWSSRAHVIPIIDDNALINRLLYSVTNVVKDGMVESISQWPGFSTFEQLAHGKRQIFTYLDRTAWWKAGGPPMNVPRQKFMREVTVETSPLPGWENLSSHERQSRFRRMIREKEAELAKLREFSGRPVMGKTALMLTDPLSKPETPKKSTPMPKCHASDEGLYKLFVEEVLKPFWAAYREASARFLAGDYNIEFPYGSIPPPIPTTWMIPRAA